LDQMRIRIIKTFSYGHCKITSMRASPRKLIIATAIIALFSSIAAADEPALKSITYRLSMSRPVSHLFEVSILIELPDELKDKPLQLQMAKWSPGRYGVFDFAKNVQEVRAVADSAARAVSRINDQTWSVSPLGATNLTVSYKVFGNDLDGTFSQLNARHANYNGGSIFMYVVGHKPDPVKLTIQAPAGWKIVNGRLDHPGQTEWQFPNWDEMIDTPTEMGPDWTQDDFEVDGKKYHVVVHSFGDESGKRPALVKDIEKIVRAEVAMWGPPEFKEYTFLLHFAADDRSGDGMEHLTSTQIIRPTALADTGTYEDTLGTVAHEFFHVWNVKRLRPQELGPWDFTRPVATRGLWVAEGFTNYYGHLMLRRAGILDDKKFLAGEAETIKRVESAQGSRLMSAIESSLTAPFIDNAPHAQTTNLQNTSISYYPKGELIGMVMDLLLRGRTKGKSSLDDVMRAMYEEFYLKSPNSSYYLRGRGYQPEDLERIVALRSGIDLGDFFKRHIRDVELLPYDEAFAYVGLRLVKTQAKDPYDLGLSLQLGPARLAIITNVRNNSPAENAGLQAGDVITSFPGKDTVERLKPGDSVPVTVKRDRLTIKTNIVVGQPEVFDYRIEEKPDATVEQKALRAAWLTGK
ncbi:MAG TPA: PDZ domain-containing protein, partial [Pyrinomonadaceae bacterium]|nr:PDZ domain-containing protein [Pyrinomonadaceae bacterium]